MGTNRCSLDVRQAMVLALSLYHMQSIKVSAGSQGNTQQRGQRRVWQICQRGHLPVHGNKATIYWFLG